MKITQIIGTEILDSRGEPTIEVSMSCGDTTTVFGVPAGASTGKNEAHELRDGGSRYEGMGVSKDIAKLLDITPRLINFPLYDQASFDELLNNIDGTSDKSNLGANTIVGLSLVYAQLSAATKRLSLWQYLAEQYKTTPSFPKIYANLVNGGKHAPGLDIQEFMIVPKTVSIEKNIEQIHSFRTLLGQALAQEFGAGAELVGDEGGYAPVGAKHQQILDIYKTINESINNHFDFALDAAASSFYKNGKYVFEQQSLSSQELLSIYTSYSQKYDILSIEDPFAEDDLEAWQELSLSQPTYAVIGDDLTVTNAEFINKYAAQKLIDGVIIKPNQIGTLSETMQAIQTTVDNNLKVIVSHRSGETTSTFISDLAYGVGAYGLKIGAPVRGERVAKYDRLLEIAKEVK